MSYVESFTIDFLVTEEARTNNLRGPKFHHRARRKKSYYAKYYLYANRPCGSH